MNCGFVMSFQFGPFKISGFLSNNEKPFLIFKFSILLIKLLRYTKT